MRYLRLTLGTAAIIAAGWVVVGEHLAGTSADAVINAEVATVRAPGPGRLTMPALQLGTVLRAAQEVGSVVDPLSDGRRLDDLAMEQAFAAAALARSQADLDAAGGARGAALTQDAQSLRRVVATPAGPGPGPDAPQPAIRAEIAAGQARLDALTTRIERERVRAARQAAAVLTSPVAGPLWERLAGDGEEVLRGQDVLRVLDCASTVVTLSVAQSVYDRLSVGTVAQFRLNGDDRVMPGTVIRMAGGGAAGLYRNLAVPPGARHLDRQDVTLLVPGLRADPALACAVGRSGKVFFDTRPLDGLRAWFG